MPKRKLYFAYGTNMNRFQMRERCPTAQRLGTAKLSNFELYFTSRGIPSIKMRKSSAVWGVLYDIDRECEVSLDRYEGFPKTYRKEKVFPDFGGEFSTAFAYIATETDFGQASKKHLNLLLEGAEENGLPNPYISEIKRRYGKREN